MKRTGGINTGASLVLVILVVMSIVTFAILSYSEATADKNLSMQAAERTKEYYGACNRAEERLALYKKNASSASGALEEEIAFTEKYGENHYLSVKAKYNEDGELIVTEWSTNYTEE